MDARPMARYFPRLIARCYSQAVPALCTVPRRHGDEAQHLAAACVLHVKHVAWQRLPLRDAAQIERERSEEHTSELQSLMRISYAVFCLKKKDTDKDYTNT